MSDQRPDRASPGMGDEAAAGVYDAIFGRRDVRRSFLKDPIPDDILERILAAAHAAPSVGLMQPWRFILIQSDEVRAALTRSFEAVQRRAIDGYQGDKKNLYASLKLEAMKDVPLLIGVTCEIDAPRGAGLGRRTWAETAHYSTVAAIQNLWLAARAEGIGVGWVSILEKDEVRAALRLPDGVDPIAILCVGYVTDFDDRPGLETAGWETRLPLADVVVRDTYDGVPGLAHRDDADLEEPGSPERRPNNLEG